MAAHASGSGREVLRIAWPLILSNSFWTLQITLDRVLLSRHHVDEVGAAMAAAMLFWTPIAFLQFTINFATSFVAQYRGAGRPARVGAVVWQGMWLSVAAGLAFLLLIPFADDIVAWAGHAPHQQALEAGYFRCLCLSGLPFLVNAAASSFFTGLGHSRTVLFIHAVGLLVNVVLSYLWIFGRAGFPEAGIEGAGWATAVGSAVSAVLGFGLMLRAEHRREYHTLRAWRLDLPLLRRLLRFGLPNGILVCLETLAFTLFVVYVGRLGAIELNASTIAFTLNLIAYLPTMGFGQAVGVLVSRRLGEEDPDGAERAVWSGLGLALGLTALLASLFVLVPGVMIGAFRPPDAGPEWATVAELARLLLYFVVVYALFDTMSLVFSFALRGAGDTRYVSLATMVLSWPLMVLPAWFMVATEEGAFLATEAVRLAGLGGISQSLGINPVLFVAWACVSAFPVSAGLLFRRRFRQGGWRALRVIETHREEPEKVAVG